MRYTTNMLNILFIGDIVGKIGRQATAKLLPDLKKKYKPDLVIANAENLAHGKGITENTVKEMLDAGVDWLTNGDHSFSNGLEIYENKNLPIIRPANFPPGLPGSGHVIIEIKKHKILLINLIGRVFMRLDYDCPFRKLDEILSNLAKEKLSAIIVDIHAETTSEKASLMHYADGRLSALIGTHTHVMTADAQITDQGTAFITDAGMTGFAQGSIGIDKQGIIKTFLEQVKYPHVIPETGPAILNAVLIKIDENNKKAAAIESIIKFINI